MLPITLMTCCFSWFAFVRCVIEVALVLLLVRALVVTDVMPWKVRHPLRERLLRLGLVHAGQHVAQAERQRGRPLVRLLRLEAPLLREVRRQDGEGSPRRRRREAQVLLQQPQLADQGRVRDDQLLVQLRVIHVGLLRVLDEVRPMPFRERLQSRSELAGLPPEASSIHLERKWLRAGMYMKLFTEIC